MENCDKLGSIEKKLFVSLSRFWPLRGWWIGVLSESVIKEKFVTKIIFSDNAE